MPTSSDALYALIDTIIKMSPQEQEKVTNLTRKLANYSIDKKDEWKPTMIDKESGNLIINTKTLITLYKKNQNPKKPREIQDMTKAMKIITKSEEKNQFV